MTKMTPSTNKIAIAALIIMASQTISAANASEIKLNVAGDTAYISGYLGPDVDASFSVISASVKNVVIKSEGGLTSVAEHISNIVHKNHMTTIVYDYCYSACAVIFASGERRIAYRKATFLIHGAHIRDGGSLPDVASALFQLNSGVINRYIEYGVNESFVREHVTYPQVMFEPVFDARTAIQINLATSLQ